MAHAEAQRRRARQDRARTTELVAARRAQQAAEAEATRARREAALAYSS